MPNYLLVSGGCERPNGYELGEGKYYERARLLKLDLESGEFATIMEKAEGGANYPNEHPNLQYTSCCVVDNTLWLPTDTEIFKLSYPQLDLQGIISYPFFHNIHAINVFDGKVYVSSTGLDLVAVLDLEGEILELFNAEGKDLWHRFSKDKDYRLEHSTRPHDCHPNFIFMLDGQPWVTRCRQQDAVCLDNISQKIEITDPKKRISVHDGIVHKDKLYFTSVDGYIIVVDPETKKITEEINVLKLLNNEKLGWARGLTISQSDIAYLAFSRLRRTRMKEKLAWLAKGQISKMSGMPACVLAFDLKNRNIIKRYEIPLGRVDAIYGVELVDA
jgi:hypothetical protein